MSTAPDFRTLVDWLDGQLPADRAAAVAAAVAAGDERIIAEVTWLHTFYRVAAQLPLEQPPPRVRHQLREDFARWARQPPQPQRAVDESSTGAGEPTSRVAWLVFDSRTDLPVTAAIGAEPGVVHRAYASDAAELLIDFAPQPDGTTRMDGLVVPFAAVRSDSFEVTVRDRTGNVSSVSSPDGRFRLDCDPGATGLEVRGRDLILRVERAGGLLT